MSRRRLLAVASPPVERLIRAVAARHPLVVTSVRGASDALAELSAMRTPDVLVLEDGPGRDGLGLLRRLRQQGVEALAMVVTRGGEKAALRAFQEGADDVVHRRTSREEVAARLGVMVRRLAMAAGPQSVLPKLKLDRERLIAAVDGREIQVTATEFQILHLLARKSGRTLSRQYLVAQIWNTRSAVRTRSVDMHVSHLRKKLAGASFKIETVPSGYRLDLNGR